MFLRVTSHILHFVIPNILEVIREEGIPQSARKMLGKPGAGRGRTPPMGPRVASFFRLLIHIGVEAICASVRYLPLWAEEIARLPGVGKAGLESEGSESRKEGRDVKEL
jgi:hypothetical protein